MGKYFGGGKRDGGIRILIFRYLDLFCDVIGHWFYPKMALNSNKIRQNDIFNLKIGMVKLFRVGKAMVVSEF